MYFTNLTTNETIRYIKEFAHNGIYKDHVFAFLLPVGHWEFASVNTSGELGGGDGGGMNGLGHFIGKKMEVQKGLGHFLGKFDAQFEPLKDLLADSIQWKGDKAEVDIIMKDRYKFFNEENTAVLKLK